MNTTIDQGVPSEEGFPAGASRVYDLILRDTVGGHLHGIFRKDHKRVA